MGSIPGLRRSHMLQATNSLRAATAEAGASGAVRACVLRSKEGCRKPVQCRKASPRSPRLGEAGVQQRRPSTTRNKQTNILEKERILSPGPPQFSSGQFGLSVVSDSLRPHELQHATPPCPSPNPGVHSDSSPSSL